ncbi:MAG TPA: hypothetical protein VKB51_15970 [bacterium]|nr:hypothetical protein [bacterium]
MNLFRSEEHARNWQGYQEGAAAGLQPLSAIAAIWGADRYRERLNGHYVSSARDYLPQVAEITARVTGGNPFWKR